MLRSRRPVILVQRWHKYGAISAQSDAHLLDSRMPYEMSCGAEKHKDLMITVPNISISVLKNMAFLADFKWFVLDSRKVAFESVATQDFSRSPRSFVQNGSSRISLRIAADAVADKASYS